MTTPTVLNCELLRIVPYVTRAMDYVGAPLHMFEDGTSALFIEESPELIYSPRLPLHDLEQFCAANLGRYKAHFAKHAAEIDDGLSVPIIPWWIEEGV